MAKINFGGVEENVVTREEFPLEKALETLKDETIAVIGYGVQGPGQSLNLRDNGFNVIVGQREGTRSWERAVADCRARRFSASRRPPSAPRSSSTCSPTPGRSPYGLQSKSTSRRARPSISPTASASPTRSARASCPRPTWT